MTRFLSQYWRIILFILALILVFWLLWNLLTVLLPFFIGMILAYLLLPVITWIENKLPAKDRLTKTKRILIILLVYFLALTIVGLVGFFTIPALIRSTTEFIDDLPQIIPNFIESIQEWTGNIRQLVPPQIRDQLDDYFADLLGNLAGAITGGLMALFTLLTASFSFILGFISLPVFLFFLLKDADKLNAGFYGTFPPWPREHIRGVALIIRDVLGRYIRSSIILGIAVAIMNFIGLTILGIPFAPALALWSGFGELIPILGPWLGAAAGIIVTLAVEPGKILWVAILYLSVQLLENNLLVPKIQSQYLRIHPSIILILLVLGGHFAGFWGVVLVVPLTATFIALARYLLQAAREESILQK